MDGGKQLVLALEPHEHPMFGSERRRAVVELDLGRAGSCQRVRRCGFRRLHRHAPLIVEERFERAVLHIEALGRARGREHLVDARLPGRRRCPAVAREAAFLARDGQQVGAVALLVEVEVREEGGYAIEPDLHAQHAHDVACGVSHRLAVRDGLRARPSQVDGAPPVAQVARIGIGVLLGRAQGAIVESALALALGGQRERGRPLAVERDVEPACHADGTCRQLEVGAVRHIHLGVGVADIERRVPFALGGRGGRAVREHEVGAIHLGAAGERQQVVGRCVDNGKREVGSGDDIGRRRTVRGEGGIDVVAHMLHDHVEVGPAENHVVLKVARPAGNALGEQVVGVRLHLLERLAAREHGHAHDALDGEGDAEGHHDKDLERQPTPRAPLFSRTQAHAAVAFLPQPSPGSDSARLSPLRALRSGRRARRRTRRPPGTAPQPPRGSRRPRRRPPRRRGRPQPCRTAPSQARRAPPRLP